MLRPLFLMTAIALALLWGAVLTGRGLPHAEQIAFQSNVAGDEDILLADVRTSRIVNLTRRQPGNQTSPAWSPDGSRLVYEFAFLGTRAVSAIYTMNADGSDVRSIYVGNAAQPTWSPDGRYITFITAQALHIAHADGSSSRVVGEDEFIDYSDFTVRQILMEKLPSLVPEASGAIVDARWSPDRERLSFTFWNGDVTQGYSLEGGCILPCDSQAEPLPNTEHTRSIMLSAAGQRAVFECRLGGYNGICVMQSDGSQMRQIVVTARGIRSIAPTWRP
jgi:Tol biopolymer transport system component